MAPHSSLANLSSPPPVALCPHHCPSPPELHTSASCLRGWRVGTTLLKKKKRNKTQHVHRTRAPRPCPTSSGPQGTPALSIQNLAWMEAPFFRLLSS